MADITVTFTDDDQDWLRNFADKTKANVDNAEAHKPSPFWTPVHNNFTAAAVMLEDKLGVARGTYYGSGSMATYNPSTGGISGSK